MVDEKKVAPKPKEEAHIQESTADLFSRALTDIDSVPKVSKYIRTGRRWDVTHKDVFGHILVLHSFKEITTRYGQAALVKVDHEGVEKMALFGTKTLLDQMGELGPNLPVIAVIRKPGKAFVLTDPTMEELREYKTKYLK